MRTLKIALLATVATAALSSATLAADLIISDPVVDNYAPVNSWEGVYFGVFGSAQSAPAVFGIGAGLGVNVLIDDSLLAGIEGELAYLGNNTWQGQVDGRLGFIADPALLYAFVGVGANSASGAYVPLGVGAEFMVTDALSLRAEYQFQWDVDNAAQNAHVGRVGLYFHF